MELKDLELVGYVLCGESVAKNPFNGIESQFLPLPFLVMQLLRESIQWN